MRIMHILGNFGPGGAEMGVVRLARYLSDPGITHSICSFGPDLEMQKHLPKDVACYTLGIKGADRTAFWSLFKLLKETATDVVHVNNIGPLIDSVIASKLARCCCIETFHGVEESSTEFAVLKKAFLRFAALHTNGLTAVSDSAADLLHSLTGIKRTRLKVIPNGVDTDFFRPGHFQEEKIELRLKMGLPPTALIFGCVAALRPVKNHSGLIRAFAEADSLLSDTPGGNNLFLTLVGDGPLENELRKLARQLNVSEKVRFLGRRDDVQDVLRALDIFVLNSQTEGLSYALLEAMASGLPSIVTKVGSNGQLVEDDVEGKIVPFGDAEALTRSIVWIARNPDRIPSMGMKAREKVVKKFALDKMISSYRNLYREIWSGRGR